MKKHSDRTRIRPGGILQWSTLCLLAGGSVALTSCDSKSTYTATAQDEQMAALQKKLDDIESRKSQLLNGYVEHNFELPGAGFYHADAQDFFPYTYGHEKDGKWYANGQWVDAKPEPPRLTTSRPSEAALRKIEMILAREQELVEENSTASSSSTHRSSYHSNHHHGSGVGNMLLMYWLLSGNRNNYTPGAGFQQAQARQQGWQQSLNNDRSTVNAHAAANPGYQRLVQQSKQSGSPVTAGKSVRGGFGGSSSGSSSSFGS